MKMQKISRLKTLLLVFIVTINAGCNKTNINKKPQNSCSQSTFQINLSEYLFSVSDITEDEKGNIFLYGTEQTNSNPKLLKLDSTGSVIWDKSIPNSLSPIELIISDNKIILLSQGQEINNNCDVLYDVGINQVGFSHNCTPIYELPPSPVFCTKYESEVKIIAVNTEGDELWSKVLPDFHPNGNSLLAIENGEILVTTLYKYGRQPEYVYDSTGNFTDTVNYPYNKDRITLYNIGQNGNIKWKSEFHNIKSSNWGYTKIPGNYTELIDDKVIIKTSNEIITTNMSGSELERHELIPEHCTNRIYYLEGVTFDQYVIGGEYSIKEDGLLVPVRYTEIKNKNNESIWHKDEFLQVIDGANGNFLVYQNGGFHGYDNNGNKKWTFEVDLLTTAIMSCNGGAIISSYENNEIIISKVDNKGKY